MVTQKEAIYKYLQSQRTWVYKYQILLQKFEGNPMADTVGRRLRELLNSGRIEKRKWEYGTQYRITSPHQDKSLAYASGAPIKQPALFDLPVKKNYGY